MCQPLITYKNAEIEYKDKIILAIDIMLYNVLMILKIYTDGGSKGNPGPSSIGGVFYLDQKKVFDFKKSIGIATNNDAEYRALIEALVNIKNQRSKIKTIDQISRLRQNFGGLAKIELYSDSRLMVNQVKGLFKVKNGRIREYILRIRGLEQEIKIPISYHLVPREENQEADKLVNSI